MPYEFYLGVDVVKKTNTVTYAIIEKSADDLDGEPMYHLRHVEQTPGRLETETFANLIQDTLARDLYVGHTIVVVNRTDSAGREVVDALRGLGLSPIEVYLSGDDDRARGSVPTDGGVLMAHSSDVLGRARMMYESGELNLIDEPTEGALMAAHALTGYGDGAPVVGGNSLDGHEASGYVSAIALALWYGTQRVFDATERMDDMLVAGVGEKKRDLEAENTELGLPGM